MPAVTIFDSAPLGCRPIAHSCILTIARLVGLDVPREDREV